MTDDCAQYEEDCDAIRAENEELLAEFATSLRQANLKETTIKGHVTNIDFYINEFLLYEDAIDARGWY